MINKEMTVNKINDKGQVLLIVVVAMAVTLGVGLGITSRSTESLKRTGNLDSFQKVTAASEGGLEKQLILADTDLERLIGTSQTVSFNNGTVSEVTITGLTAGSSGMIFEKIKPSDTVTFLMTDLALGTPGTSCVELIVEPRVDYLLNVVTSNPSPLVGSFTTSNRDGINQVKTGEYILENYLYSGGSFKSQGPETPAVCQGKFRFSNAYMLRFQPLSGEVVKLTVKPTNTGVQRIIQGFKLVSKGRFSDEISDKTSRTIEAYKYLDTPSSIYNYAVFVDNN